MKLEVSQRAREAAELLPCPFCGGEARLHIGMVSFDDAEIHCEACCASGPNHDEAPFRDEAQAHNTASAVEEWNTRADLSQPLADRVARLEEALERIKNEADHAGRKGLKNGARYWQVALIEIESWAKEAIFEANKREPNDGAD